MIDKELLYKMSSAFCIAVLFSFNSYAQQLTNTDWVSITKMGISKPIRLHFGRDTLWTKPPDEKGAGSMSFLQKHDTLLVFNSSDKNACPRADTAYYKITYQYNSQHLFLTVIRGSCDYNKAILNKGFNYVAGNGGAERDWSYRDPMTDSIAGISLYKAYEMLKGRKSNTVVVAVIDNGFDITHEDLKNIVWTNTKEIPGNGIDDDHNGYIDDLHGWNFRGDNNGHIVSNEQAGATQTFVALKNKYESADTIHLSGDEEKQFTIYKKAKRQYFETLKATKDSVELKYAYNADYKSEALIRRDSPETGNRVYGSPVLTSTADLSHGTHVAGIIAAVRNNNKGVDGIADNALIMPIIATTGIGDERDKDVANAIIYAVNNGARLINMSFSKRYSPYKKLVDSAVRYAEQKHVLIIHAAGNEGNNNDTANYYPVARYKDGKKASNFITVGWSRPLFNYRLAHPFSGYGKDNVDVFAPGSDIFSTVPGDLYDYKSGSSMSTPCVTGVAALLLSYFPDLTTQQVKDIIMRSSFKPDVVVNRPGGSKVQVAFSSLSVSGGIVNAYNAVKMAIDISAKR